ncbi:MAG: glycosyltransferase family 9 protein, partial [Melioribacteraceae bacterium]|nr:glycosyltransferase family 9 protein [Melioribacteraceae bacterium]
VIQWLIAAPKRTGINYLHQNLRNFNFLSNIRIDESNDLHNVETNIKLVDRVTRKTTDSIPELRFPIPEKNQQNAQQILNGFGIKESDKVIGFHPGGSIPKNHINKRWSPEKYAELAKYLIEKKSFKVCVFGGPDESDLKSEIIKRTGSEYCYAIDTKSLVDTAAVMRRCDLFVSNDSSLMHVAAALQLKTVAIEGPLNINFTRPWKTEHKIVSLNLECSPCFYYSPKHLTCYRDDVKFKCMKEISVEMVKNKFDEINS